MPRSTTITPPVVELAELSFHLCISDDWQPLAVPDQLPDFSDPDAFAPLAIFVHQSICSTLWIAARPAYQRGNLLEWLEYVARSHQWTVEQYDPIEVSGSQAAGCLASDPAAGAPITLRCILSEDGGYLILLCGSASRQSWPVAGKMLDEVLSSFELVRPRGATVPVMRVDPCQKPGDAGSTSTANYADFAMLSDAERCEAPPFGIVAARSIGAWVHVPPGWHVHQTGRDIAIDNGQGTRITLSLLGTEAVPQGDARPYFDQILTKLAQTQPQAQFNVMELDGCPTLIMTGIVEGGAAIAEACILKAIDRRAGQAYLDCRLRAPTPKLARAGDLLQLILQDLRLIEGRAKW